MDTLTKIQLETLKANFQALPQNKKAEATRLVDQMIILFDAMNEHQTMLLDGDFNDVTNSLDNVNLSKFRTIKTITEI